MKKKTLNLLKFIIVLIIFIILVSTILKIHDFINLNSVNSVKILNSVKIIIINLKRSADRKKDMENKMKSLNLTNYVFFEAVDAKVDLYKYNYKTMDNWVDPDQNRGIINGEIGCSLSHYLVWKYIVENNISKALILEDDVVFKNNFKKMYTKIINMNIDYDMLYLGRIHMNVRYNLGAEEKYNDLLVKAKYSYCTACYIMTKNGCQKSA
jgi:GR25 family glycosyltransferase involved in LPS biosynthesis